VPTWQRIRADKSLADLWELMSDDEIRAVGRSSCVRIGSHGYWHNNLGNLPPADAAAELQKSKRYLENLVQREVPDVAYPDGSYSRGLVPLAAELGFRDQLAVRFHFPEDASTR
jgi:peptidoglycan/xylan/chitin deacetylase (PgdA/CDA1 family)